MSATAVVTGAAGGLGRAIAHRFAREGIRVALWDVDLAGAQRVGGQIGEGTHAFAVDVTDTGSVRAAWSATKEALGTPSILVNSAGILGPSAGIASYPEEQWHRVPPSLPVRLPQCPSECADRRAARSFDIPGMSIRREQFCGYPT